MPETNSYSRLRSRRPRIAAIREPRAAERPRVPLYYDQEACHVCGADGHAADSCPRLQHSYAI